MKRSLVLLALPLLLACLVFSAFAAGDALDEAAAQTGDALFSLVDDDTAETLEQFGLSDFSANQVFDVSWNGIRAFFSRSLRDALQAERHGFALSLSLLLVIACVRTLLGPHGDDAAFDLLALCAVTVQTASCMHRYVSAAAAALSAAGTFMQGFIPVYAGLLAFSGHPGAALSYQSLCFALAQGISAFASRFCVPALGLFFCLGIAFAMQQTVNTAAFLSAVNKASSVLLGLLSGVFAAVLSIRQVLAGAADSAAIRSARFLVGSLIPVVGSAMSDAYSAVLCSIDLIKGSALVFAFLVFAVLHLPVLLSLLLGRLGCGALGALAQTLGEARLSVLYQVFGAGVRLLGLVSVYECFLLVVATGLTLQLRQ